MVCIQRASCVQDRRRGLSFNNIPDERLRLYTCQKNGERRWSAYACRLAEAAGLSLLANPTRPNRPLLPPRFMKCTRHCLIAPVFVCASPSSGLQSLLGPRKEGIQVGTSGLADLYY